MDSILRLISNFTLGVGHTPMLVYLYLYEISKKKDSGGCTLLNSSLLSIFDLSLKELGDCITMLSYWDLVSSTTNFTLHNEKNDYVILPTPKLTKKLFNDKINGLSKRGFLTPRECQEKMNLYDALHKSHRKKSFVVKSVDEWSTTDFIVYIMKRANRTDKPYMGFLHKLKSVVISKFDNYNNKNELIKGYIDSVFDDYIVKFCGNSLDDNHSLNVVLNPKLVSRFLRKHEEGNRIESGKTKVSQKPIFLPKAKKWNIPHEELLLYMKKDKSVKELLFWQSQIDLEEKILGEPSKYRGQ